MRTHHRRVGRALPAHRTLRLRCEGSAWTSLEGGLLVLLILGVLVRLLLLLELLLVRRSEVVASLLRLLLLEMRWRGSTALEERRLIRSHLTSRVRTRNGGVVCE